MRHNSISTQNYFDLSLFLLLYTWNFAWIVPEGLDTSLDFVSCYLRLDLDLHRMNWDLIRMCHKWLETRFGHKITYDLDLSRIIYNVT